MVVQRCKCPGCKKLKTLRVLPANFKCVDVICDFCGYLAQVKTATVANINKLPNRLLGAAWGPQKARMDAGIYFPLFIVLVGEGTWSHSVYFLSADLQQPEMFSPRKALSENARRAGWQGFMYELNKVQTGALVRQF